MFKVLGKLSILIFIVAVVIYGTTASCSVFSRFCEYSGVQPNEYDDFGPARKKIQGIMLSGEVARFEGLRFRRAGSVFDAGYRVEVVAAFKDEDDMIVAAVRNVNPDIERPFRSDHGKNPRSLLGVVQIADDRADLYLFVIDGVLADDKLSRQTYKISCPRISPANFIDIEKLEFQTNLGSAADKVTSITVEMSHNCGSHAGEEGKVYSSPLINGFSIGASKASDAEITIKLDDNLRQMSVEAVVLRQDQSTGSAP